MAAEAPVEVWRLLVRRFREAKHLQERLPIGIVCQKVKMFVAVMQQEVVAFVSLGTL